MKKEYTNGDVTIIWEPEICTHSGKCARGLPSVFKPSEKPWVNANGASTEEIIEQVKKMSFGSVDILY